MITDAYGMEISIEQNADGEVTPTVPVTWNLTDKLLAKLQQKGFTSPHVMLVVTSSYPTREGGYDFTSFRTTQVRLARLDARREYVSF